jgi:hypothetical protein
MSPGTDSQVEFEGTQFNYYRDKLDYVCPQLQLAGCHSVLLKSRKAKYSTVVLVSTVRTVFFVVYVRAHNKYYGRLRLSAHAIHGSKMRNWPILQILKTQTSLNST